MEILIDDIPDEGLKVSATEADGWFLGLVKDAVGDAFEKTDHASVTAFVSKIDGNVSIDGKIVMTSHPDCDRCLAHYSDSMSVPFHTVLSPLYESRQEERDAEEEGTDAALVKEDMEFGFYEGDRFDLKELVREHALLAQPMKRLCREDCKGLCPTCAKDLNKGPCKCKKEKGDPRFAVLKKIKVTR